MSPLEAASTIAMQKASVSEQFKKISLKHWKLAFEKESLLRPLTRTFLTSLWGIEPSSSTLLVNSHLYIISSRGFLFGPSPAMIKYTSGNFLHMMGMTSISKSTPFLKVSLYIQTIFIVLRGNLFDGSGLNLLQSTALGITDMSNGLKLALKVKFSFDVWETEMAWSN